MVYGSSLANQFVFRFLVCNVWLYKWLYSLSFLWLWVGFVGTWSKFIDTQIAFVSFRPHGMAIDLLFRLNTPFAHIHNHSHTFYLQRERYREWRTLLQSFSYVQCTLWTLFGKLIMVLWCWWCASHNGICCISLFSIYSSLSLCLRVWVNASWVNCMNCISGVHWIVEKWVISQQTNGKLKQANRKITSIVYPHTTSCLW